MKNIKLTEKKEKTETEDKNEPNIENLLKKLALLEKRIEDLEFTGTLQVDQDHRAKNNFSPECSL